MKTLGDVVADGSALGSIVADCVRLVDSEVGSKGGLSGMAIKAGYKLVQGAKPGFVESAVRALLPDFATVLDPICAEAADKGQGVQGYLTGQADRVADALLGITDDKVSRSDNSAVQGAYKKLRGTAKKNVSSAVPGLAEIIENYTR